MEFEWDIQKAESNFRKHKVSFEESKSVFFDPLALTVNDDDLSFEEDRFITIGESKAGRVILVCHTIGEENVRINSARTPTKGERKDYEHG
jgi:uncharacterized DUF497 family protein